MATYDISRVAFNPLRHYTSVRMQQGRVLTDDDWNENERIEDEVLRRTNVDIIGRAGSPDDGFKIESLSTAGGFIDFDIKDGIMYLGGNRLEMDSQKVISAVEKFRLQRDWLQKKDPDFLAPLAADFAAGVTELFNLVYLEAWQQPVCAVEDNALFEAALGGPDTTTRLRYMRRVRIYKGTESDECALAWCKLKTEWTNKHLGTVNKECELIPDTKLKVTFVPGGDPNDLCSPAAAGGYLGAENQAIRVQVTQYDPNTNTGKFTWGYDNASPLYRVSVAADRTTVKMITDPKDQFHWPLTNQVVEILPWSAALSNNEKVAELTGVFSKVALSYNPDDPNNKFFTLATPIPVGFGAEWKNRADKVELAKPGEYFYLRVWNRGTDLGSAEEIIFNTGNPVALGNTGLQVTFTGNDFIAPNGTGNFWVIAARPSTPQSVVPWELTSATGIGPHGNRFFYTPLATIRWTLVGGVVTGELRDCRRHFNPLTEQECCCTFSVGDGVTSKGDFNSIQTAIDSLPADGGKICILPGIHEAAVLISGRKKIHITGCGEHSIVRTPANNNKPIFTIEFSNKIRIDNLTLVALEGIAILAKDPDDGTGDSVEITIRENRILALVHAIRVDLNARRGGNNVKIAFNHIGMLDKTGGDVAIFSLADDVLIERNRIVMIFDARDPQNPDPEPPPDGVFDPCGRLKDWYAKNKKFKSLLEYYFLFISKYFFGKVVKNYTAPGGIQIGAGSEKVWILQNEIMGGKGNGITLGHVVPAQFDAVGYWIDYVPALYDIIIQENLIVDMGLCGIGTVFHTMREDKAAAIFCKDLLIVENLIRHCVQDIESPVLLKGKAFINNDEVPVAPISLTFVEHCIIRENRIENNGLNQLHAICGVFVAYADKVELAGNHIINNGPDIQEPTALNRRVRGGIVIWFAIRLPRRKMTYDGDGLNKAALFDVKVPGSPDANPAAKIHDNIVTQPLGHALFLIAFGPVSVVANQFTSQGINKREIFSLLAGTVFIFNLGISKDLLNILLMPLMKWGFINPSMWVAASAAVNNKNENPLVFELQDLPDGRIMYAANQVMLDMRSLDMDGTLSSQLIFSLDDISYVTNQSECAAYVGLLPGEEPTFTADIALFNTVLFGISTRCNDNRFTDGFSFTLYSLLSLALVSTAIGNQSTHCLIVPYRIYRRKALNIEINVLDCSELQLEQGLSNKGKHASDKRFNFVSN